MNFLTIFVIAIITIQIFLFFKTGKLISRLKKALSGTFRTNDTDSPTTIVRLGSEDQDEISKDIETAINAYMITNKGSVSDFNLIKDIVERNCDSLEAEISSQTPLPLYLGLMGTVAGIIIGLFTITLSGGFSQIDKVIEILMGDVAIAMVASFMGIGFTTLTLWKSKQCKATVETNKNRFYTWFQITLLPVISKSAVSAITLLQQNLTHFNRSFADTVERLENKLGDVGDVYESQIEILDKIEAIDVKKMAIANVKVLAALDGSMGSLDRFAKYMGSVTEYLNAVRDLNGKLDEHLERTEVLATVSDFYKKQMGEIGLRQEAIQSAVISVDDVMKSALATLQANSEKELRSMQEAFVGQMTIMQNMVDAQTKQLTAQIEQMPQVVQKLEEISAIPSQLNKLIDRIEKSNATLAKNISQSVRSIPTGSIGQTETGNQPTNRKWVLPIAAAIIAASCAANLIVNIKMLNAQERTQMEEATQEEVSPNDYIQYPLISEPEIDTSKSDSTAA